MLGLLISFVMVVSGIFCVFLKNSFKVLMRLNFFIVMYFVMVDGSTSFLIHLCLYNNLVYNQGINLITDTCKMPAANQS